LIFVTLDGVLCGWNPAVDSQPVVIRDTWTTGRPSVFTGLEIGQDSAGNNVLYAADFLNNDVEMIENGKDGSFTTVHTIPTAGRGVSSDPTYSWVWSVQAVNNNLYVTFADLLNPNGNGGGAVDVYDMDGNYQYQLDANGPGALGRLQNPWGITQAPANFGAYSNDLLVGNVAGKGNINVYNPITRQYLGQLLQPDGTPIAIRGLWDLEFGDGTPHGGKTNQLFFDAGPNHPNDGTDGLFGVIHVAGDQDGDGGGDPEREAAAPSAQLRQVAVSIQALPVSYLGGEAGNQVWISPNAAGWAWNVGAPAPTAGPDLRSVPDHAVGHVLGLADSDNLQDVLGQTPADPPWTW
jgi:uncharacterized protein (TIGR03118 family)